MTEQETGPMGPGLDALAEMHQKAGATGERPMKYIATVEVDVHDGLEREGVEAKLQDLLATPGFANRAFRPRLVAVRLEDAVGMEGDSRPLFDIPSTDPELTEVSRQVHEALQAHPIEDFHTRCSFHFAAHLLAQIIVTQRRS